MMNASADGSRPEPTESAAASLDAALKARSVPGGTSPDQVRAAIKEAAGMIEKFTSSAGR